ncbi:hypothetical protein F5Y03DRAFT_400786 [Xylaria venustula]|nr:hypothetical protein F5Y03DRAFT_400786 [Xylaria venustula]
MASARGPIRDRITSLSYEMQLKIFCEMDSMASVEALAEAYPYCKSIFLQNEAKINRSTRINMACRIARQISENIEYRFVKLAILIVTCPDQPQDAILSRLAPTYLSDDRLPPDVEASSLDDKWEEFRQVMAVCQRYIRVHEYVIEHAAVVSAAIECIYAKLHGSPPLKHSNMVKRYLEMFKLLVTPDAPWWIMKHMYSYDERTNPFLGLIESGEVEYTLQSIIREGVSILGRILEYSRRHSQE